jgi:predicted alpha-1,2-mannosidase
MYSEIMRNKKWFFFVFSCILLSSCTSLNEKNAERMLGYVESPVDYVNPLMGTLSNTQLSAGNTYPIIAMPWGMNFWTPQTGKSGNGWMYVYTDEKIRGFKQTHQPDPWINDYGQFSIMPVIGKNKITQENRASWFSHKKEIVTPYYYSVYLADHNINVELTPTERAALFRMTFPESDDAFVVIDVFSGESYIKIVPEKNMITGYSTSNSGGVPDNFANYFVIVFDRPFVSYNVSSEEKIVRGELELEDYHVGAVVGFQTKKGDFIQVKVASSFISEEQALINLEEIEDDNFDLVKEKGKAKWNEILGKIKISGGSEEQYRTFYSCLYRSVLFPRKFYERDEEGNIYHYSPYDGEIYDGYMYTDINSWDTFRALFPLLNLVYPAVSKEIQESLVNVYKESDFLPEWASPGHRDCMIGNNSASMVADAYLKGIQASDITLLYEAMLSGANSVHPEISSVGRLGYEYYNSLGYIPYNVGIEESVSRTLEYAYSDWCIMKLAEVLDRPQEVIDLYAQRSQNYRNVFDKESNLMRGRNKEGNFQSPFNPFKWGDAFTEGNSWHYTWSAFHDIEGLIQLMGGQENFVQMLDSVFVLPPVYDYSYYGFLIPEITEMQIMNMGNYAHGNSSVQHLPYLYNYAGQPWKTQYWVRRIMDNLYHSGYDGYCGDEANGQLSAWYVFSALGFYPVCPGNGEYVLGTPLFQNVVLHLENGNNVIISAPDNNSENKYIESFLLNEEEYTANYLTHEKLLEGAKIDIVMSSQPNLNRGSDENDFPYSFSFFQLEERKSIE